MRAATRHLFSFIHNCIAHPLLFWTGSAGWAIRFHDWSSVKMHDQYPKLYVRREASGGALRREWVEGE